MLSMHSLDNGPFPGCSLHYPGSYASQPFAGTRGNYRLSLERLAQKNGVSRNVIFFNRFVDLDELTAFIGAADIYITPYLNEAQITSGTLAYSFGAGKAIVSTPYWHASELLAENRDMLVPFNDPAAIAKAVNQLLDKETRRHAMRKTAPSGLKTGARRLPRISRFPPSRFSF